MKPGRLPRRILVAGELHVPVLARVGSRDDEGRPRDLRLFMPGEDVDAHDGDEFVVAYVLSTVLGDDK